MAKRPKIEAHFQVDVLTDDIELIRFSGTHWDDILYFPKHYQIGRIVRGAGTFFVRQEPHPVKTGDFYAIHPGLLHSGKPDPDVGWAVDVLHIQPGLVGALAETLYGQNQQPTFPRIVIRDEPTRQALAPIFTDLIDSVGQPQTKLEREGRLLHTTALLLERCTGNQPAPLPLTDHPAVQKAQQFITEHSTENVSLDELAEAACLSKFHLLRLFSARFGLTPHAYQIQLRLNEARRLIFSGQSLTEVAHTLGFADQSHFTNTFKRYADLGPKELLKTAIFFNFRE